MASPFNKIPGDKPPLGPYSRERIAPEIDHLRHRGTVRRADGKTSGGFRGAGFIILVVLIFLGLFFMDPVLHAWHRGEAVRDYLYLHHFGSEPKARQLLATGIFSPAEIELLNRRQGSFQNYYSGPGHASRAADSIIRYLQGVSALQAGAYDRLNTLGKIRYQLFVRFGLHPPVSWNVLDPSIGE